ncbi:MAG: hypothetical protein DWP97_09535 [Calditrichaeota bacterium]|nr:MAG: hypothetical protein DWP97_09535 [Calditrichota bacterium]
MKRILILLSILLLSNTSLRGQDKAPAKIKPFNIYASAGLSTTSDPEWLKDFHKVGYHLEGAVGFNFLPATQLVFKYGINNVSKDFEFIEGASDFVDGGKLKMRMYGIDVRFAPGPPLIPFRPFVFAGVGLSRITEDDITYTGPADQLADFYDGGTIDDQSKLYVNFGGGFEFGSGPIKFFAQVKYLQVKTKEQGELKFVPISFGVKF